MLLFESYLSLNLTLNQVALNRQELPVYYPISLDSKIERCLLGVPYGYGWLIDKEVIVKPESGGQFRMLVVDVEQKKHHPYMRQKQLVDTNCQKLVHQKAKVILERTVH